MDDPSNVIPLDQLLELKLGKRADRVLSENPQLALEIQRRLNADAGIAPPPIDPTPIETPPVAYVLHKFTTRCLACNAHHTHPETYALYHIKGSWGRSSREWRPTQTLDWNIPLEVHEVSRTTTFCHECLDATRDHLKTLRVPAPPRALANTLSSTTPTSGAGAGAAPKGRPSRAKPTLDDLMKL